jgi:hypothetical protein
VLLGILAVGLAVVIFLLAAHSGGGGGTAPSPEELRRRLDVAVASWTGQGWAVESQTADSAILRRGGEGLVVSVDHGGHVSTRPLSGA